MTARARLVIVAGNGEGKGFWLEGAPLLIGTSKQAAVRLTGPKISEEHALVERDSSGAALLRNRSVAGTFVNQRRVDVCELKHGDLIQIGEGAILEYQVGDKKSGMGPAAQLPNVRGKLSTKQLLIAIGVALYLAGMVALVITFETAQEEGSSAAMAERIAVALKETHERLLSMDLKERVSGAGAATVARFGSDPSAPFFALVAAREAELSSDEVGNAADAVIAPIRVHLQEARVLEQQGRLGEARRHYRQVVDALPDTRLPAARYAVERLLVIRGKLSSDE